MHDPANAFYAGSYLFLYALYVFDVLYVLHVLSVLYVWRRLHVLLRYAWRRLYVLLWRYYLHALFVVYVRWYTSAYVLHRYRLYRYHCGCDADRSYSRYLACLACFRPLPKCCLPSRWFRPMCQLRQRCMFRMQREFCTCCRCCVERSSFLTFVPIGRCPQTLQRLDYQFHTEHGCRFLHKHRIPNYFQIVKNR